MIFNVEKYIFKLISLDDVKLNNAIMILKKKQRIFLPHSFFS